MLWNKNVFAMRRSVGKGCIGAMGNGYKKFSEDGMVTFLPKNN